MPRTDASGGASRRDLDVPSERPATVPTPEPSDPRLQRLSLNVRTARYAGLRETVDACARCGIGALGLWRETLAETGLAAATALVRTAGLRVSTLCRGGFLTQPGAGARSRALDDNRRALAEANAVGAGCLVLVPGGLPAGSQDLRGARERVAAALERLAPEAAAAGVRLAIEPMHPLFCADRGVVCTLDQALRLAAPHPASAVGVVVDSYHVWWDPALEQAIAAGAPRIASYQVSDWVYPLPADNLLGRGMVGDGSIDHDRLTRTVAAAGYGGDVEVEIFNEAIWRADLDRVLATIARRHVQHIAPGLEGTAHG